MTLFTEKITKMMKQVLGCRGQCRQAVLELLCTLIKTHELQGELHVAKNRLEIMQLTNKVHKQLHSEDETLKLEKENAALKAKVSKLQTLRDLYRKNLSEMQAELDILRATQKIPEVPLP